MIFFRCNERSNPGCENPITLDECVSIFRVLQSEYYTEYKMYDLESLAIALVFPLVSVMVYLKNEFNFWNVHGIMNTSGLLQSKSIHDSMNIPKI